jgi:hypothetical protein
MDLCHICIRQWTMSSIILIYWNLFVGEIPTYSTTAPSFIWKPYRQLFNTGEWFPHETMTFTPHATTQDEFFTHRLHFPYLLALCQCLRSWKYFSSVSQNVTESQGLRIVVAENKAKYLYKLCNKNLYFRNKLTAKSKNLNCLCVWVCRILWRDA